MTLVAPTLESFFTDRLAKQRYASPRTVASYRDALKLLLVFVHDHTGTPPARLDWAVLVRIPVIPDTRSGRKRTSFLLIADRAPAESGQTQRRVGPVACFRLSSGPAV